MNSWTGCQGEYLMKLYLSYLDYQLNGTSYEDISIRYHCSRMWVRGSLQLHVYWWEGGGSLSYVYDSLGQCNIN